MSSTICYPDSTDWGCADPEWLEALDPEIKTRAEMLAWSTLVSLSGYQFSICPITVRPCSSGCLATGTYYASPAMLVAGTYAGVRPTGRSGFTPHINGGGQWVNGCGCAADDCSCTALCEARLPGQVGGITEVWLNGAVLDPTAYRVDNGNRLVRVDGECWPACQDMTEDAHGLTAFSVTYYQGVAPNALLDFAAGVLAQEYAFACTGAECRLPSNVTAISRQGVSYQMNADPFLNGFTGIDEVDAVLRIYNPNGLRQAPIIASPDARPRARVTTWGA